jgi:hypothetical protein
MNSGILRIALLCIVIGSASIPISFAINPNPFVVWFGNALGSVLSALVVIFIANRITNQRFKKKISRWRVGNKVVTLYDEGQKNKKVDKAGIFIDKHGLRIFSLLCPIFPGVTISTIVVYVLDLDKQIYKKWMLAGVFFVSGAYCFGYWFIFLH